MGITLNDEVVDSFIEGSEEAFEKVFIYYNKKVRYFIANIVRSDIDAEELCQDVFVKLWENRQAILSPQKMSSFIFSIARNQALDHLRKRKIHDKYIKNELHTGESSQSENDNINAEYIEFLTKLIIDKLPKKQKTIFLMSHRDGLSSDEIAQRLNISKKTVDNNLAMTKAIFRKMIYIWSALYPFYYLANKALSIFVH